VEILPKRTQLSGIKVSNTHNTPDVDFSFVRYANCWEDASLLIKALQPVSGKRILSIASAGDNSLSMLAAGAEVVAADLNPAQLACTELRKEAIRKLERSEFIQFAGIDKSQDRRDVYDHIRPALSGSTQKYWDQRTDIIDSGFIHAGKFEKYFGIFRKRILPLIHSRSTVIAALEPKNEHERRQFYDRVWNNRRWRFLFKVFFSRKVMGMLGRDPEFFRHVKVPVAKHIIKRAEYAFTKLDTSDNPYLDYILTGNYSQSLPHYLLSDNYDSIRKNIDNLTIRLGAIDALAQEYGADSFDGFNLSDIFEYLSAEQSRDVYVRLLGSARSNARFAYWNMLVPRTCSSFIPDKAALLENESQSLFLEDKAFFYSRFVVEQVL